MIVRGIVADTLTIPPSNPPTSGHFFNYCNTPPTFAELGYKCTPLYWLSRAVVIGTPKIGSTFTAIGYGRPPAFYAVSIAFTP